MVDLSKTEATRNALTRRVDASCQICTQSNPGSANATGAWLRLVNVLSARSAGAPVTSSRKGRTSQNDRPCEIIGGAGTHVDAIHLAVISATGQPIADREFTTNQSEYRAAIEFLTRHGAPRVVGVEGPAAMTTDSPEPSPQRAFRLSRFVARIAQRDDAGARPRPSTHMRQHEPRSPGMGYPNRKTNVPALFERC